MEAQAAGRIHPFKVCVTAEAVVNPGRASTDFNAVLGILGSSVRRVRGLGIENVNSDFATFIRTVVFCRSPD